MEQVIMDIQTKECKDCGCLTEHELNQDECSDEYYWECLDCGCRIYEDE